MNNGQIIFTLKPTYDEVRDQLETRQLARQECQDQQSELLVWQVYSFRDISKVIEFGEELVACVGVKTPAKNGLPSSVIARTYRIVPAGHQVSLRDQGGQAMFSTADRSFSDRPISIRVHNATKTPQAFALATWTASERSFEPDIPSPMLLYNKIRGGERGCLEIMTALKLQAFFYSGSVVYQPGMKLPPDMSPVMDGNNPNPGNPWSVILQDLNQVESWSIRRIPSGQFAIESVSPFVTSVVLNRDLHSMNEKIDAAHLASKSAIQASGQVQSLFERGMSKLNTRVDGHDNKFKAFEDKMSSIHYNISQYNDGIHDIQVAMEAYEAQLSGITDNDKRTSNRLNELKDGLRVGLSNLERRVGITERDIAQCQEDLLKKADISSIDAFERELMKNKRVVRDCQVEVKAVDERLSTKVVNLSQNVDQLSGLDQRVNVQFAAAAKAAQNDVLELIARLGENERQVDSCLRQGDKNLTGLQSVEGKLTRLDDRIRGVEIRQPTPAPPPPRAPAPSTSRNTVHHNVQNQTTKIINELRADGMIDEKLAHQLNELKIVHDDIQALREAVSYLKAHEGDFFKKPSWLRKK